jgi:hypothetical protein
MAEGGWRCALQFAQPRNEFGFAQSQGIPRTCLSSHRPQWHCAAYSLRSLRGIYRLLLRLTQPTRTSAYCFACTPEGEDTSRFFVVMSLVGSFRLVCRLASYSRSNSRRACARLVHVSPEELGPHHSVSHCFNLRSSNSAKSHRGPRGSEPGNCEGL